MPHVGNKRLPGEHLRTMSTINICKMIFKDAKLKSKNFISIFSVVLELLREVPKRGSRPAWAAIPTVGGLTMKIMILYFLIDKLR